MSWDVTKPKQYLIKKEGFAQEHVDTIETEYKKFLAATAIFSDSYMPVCRDVDLLWHAHILFTKDYRRMEKECVGAAIDHMPALTEEDSARLVDAYVQNTLPALKKIFGEDLDMEIWAPDAQVCKCCSTNED